MLKVIIADDEIYEREYLDKVLCRQYDGILEVVYMAADGADMLEKALLYHPDIAILDIRMPRLDGLEAAAQLIDRLPGIQIIIVSAYDEFSYARQAMKLGVRDYLVKPWLDTELTETLNNVILNVSRAERRDVPISRPDSGRDGHDGAAVWYLAFPEHRNEDMLRRGLTSMGIAGGRYKCLVFYSECILRLQETGIEIIKGIFNISHAHTLVGSLFEQLCVYIFAEDDSVFSDLNQRIRKARSFLQEYAEVPVLCGVSGICENEGEWEKAYLEASSYISEYVDEKTRKGYELSVNNGRALLDILDKARFAILAENREQTAAWLVKLEEMLSAGYDGEYSAVIFRLSLEALFRVINAQSADRVDSEKAARIKQLLEDSDIQSSIPTIADILTEGSSSRQSSHNALLVRKAKDYINEHYHEAISLQTVSEELGVSYGHLSKCMRAADGTGFSEYLTSVRLSEAKKLIKEGNLSMQDIAYTVGFSDPDYFRKTFKKYENMSPTDYQAMRTL